MLSVRILSEVGIDKMLSKCILPEFGIDKMLSKCILAEVRDPLCKIPAYSNLGPASCICW